MADLRSDDLRTSLEALRDVLAKELEDGARCVKCGGSVSSATPALAKQLRDTVTQLNSLAIPKGSVTDDLKRKRAQRQAGVQKRSASGK